MGRPAQPQPPESAATLLLVRHGLTAVTGSRLAGRTPGLHLDGRGRAQAEQTARRLAPLRLDAVVTSPMERCVQTAAAIAAATGTPVTEDERFTECDYGDWTGRDFDDLRRDPHWPIVQHHPSAARFPGGETLAAMAARAVAAVRDWNDRLAAATPAPVYLVCTHGDIIKAVVADALGLHLDQFQRIVPDPCSLTAVRYTPTRPFLVRLNDVGGSVDGLLPGPAATSGDAAVGGGAGAAGCGRSADPSGGSRR
ncbi:putative phosphoglycerate mutase [Nocardiopsis mwathae]|uniref:Putative phosphoglycerate mutase n=1 Tax=Nocardiopsis mwathae TaxID=1472723 RepID=A0A7W9YFX9_9ACTN|nr:MSMEG_4193 family putative phosphomutase [Nocardiopsis mwathae]MBB6171433.1 putative phosphoglycerate mutase [Nocardiopsis mwathae]